MSAELASLTAVLWPNSGQARAAATRLVSALARIELGNGTWPELLPWLWSLSETANPAHREVALQTIYMLLDTLVVTPSKPGGSIANHIPQLLQLFNKTLNDSESLGVRVWTVRALGKLSEFIEQGENQEIVSLVSLLASSSWTDPSPDQTGSLPIARPRHRQRSVPDPRGSG